jgi:hypothetical protein
MRRWLSDGWYKLRHWEYWPFGVLYFPVFFYWLFLSLRERSLLFFTASNPGIYGGGMTGESKSSIYRLIPAEYLPHMILAEPDWRLEYLHQMVVSSGIAYPFICKPDVGERGTNVEKIINPEQLIAYHKRQRFPYFIQEYISYQVEAGVFYYRLPGSDRGIISSVTLKNFLTVTGDGKSKVKELMNRIPRSRFQVRRLEESRKELLDSVPGEGEKVEVEPVDNHCRGTLFLNGESQIDDKLIETIDSIARRIIGFYYGRFDIRCASIEDLRKGVNFRILELNGAGSEPTHIYHPGTSIWSAYRIIFHHLKILWKISRQNHQAGIPYMKFSQGLRDYLQIRRVR